MSQYYTPHKTRNLFDPLRHGLGQASKEPFKLSRSKIDLFIECPRCFYLDRRLGVSRPPGFPFNLNSAVDALLKKEFDIHRAKNTAHPLMKTYKIDAVPFEHKDINIWRDTFKGISFLHEPTNFLVFGGIDDVWINPKKELHVVDYKATSKNSEVNLDAEWQDGYKRQMEVYQWLFEKNNFAVSPTGFFVYANAGRDREAFDGRLEFDVKIIPYNGSSGWVEGALRDMLALLTSHDMPQKGGDCDYCLYREAVSEVIHEKDDDNRTQKRVATQRLF